MNEAHYLQSENWAFIVMAGEKKDRLMINGDTMWTFMRFFRLI